MSPLPPREFVGAVRAWCAAHELLPPRSAVVVGVSGGPDSVALLQVLHELSGPLALRLHVAHLDHALRPGSAADAAFTARRACALGWPCTIERRDVARLARSGKLGLEEAGRLARYSFFHRVAVRTGAALVAVGHSRDDQAETVLMRLLRGASVSGLSGIAPRRPLDNPLSTRRSGWVSASAETHRSPLRAPGVSVIRPLLTRSRAEIEAFLKWREIEPRHDPSNASQDFLRNRIRRGLIPYLERRYNPNVRSALARAGEILAEEDELLEARALSAVARAKSGRGELSLRALRALPVAVRRRVLRLAAVGAGAVANRLGAAHLEALVRLASAGSGEAHLPGLSARAGRGRLRLLRRV